MPPVARIAEESAALATRNRPFSWARALAYAPKLPRAYGSANFVWREIDGTTNSVIG